jgi:hypothetical protein
MFKCIACSGTEFYIVFDRTKCRCTACNELHETPNSVNDKLCAKQPDPKPYYDRWSDLRFGKV